MADVLESADTVYHYTRKSIGIELILSKMQLKLNRYANTNDPHEYRERHTAAVLDGRRYDTDIFADLADLFVDYVQNTKIGCFCRNVTERKQFYPAYQKNRMWSQYGENHEGLCLAFSKKKLFSDVKTMREKTYAGNVLYFREEDRFHESLLFSEDSSLDIDINEYIFDHITRHREEIFLMKHVDYRDEDEYRLYVIDNRNNDCFCNISDSIVAVILGDRFPDVYEEVVRNLCGDMGVACYRYRFRNFRSSIVQL